MSAEGAPFPAKLPAKALLAVPQDKPLLPVTGTPVEQLAPALVEAGALLAVPSEAAETAPATCEPEQEPDAAAVEIAADVLAVPLAPDVALPPPKTLRWTVPANDVAAAAVSLTNTAADAGVAQTPDVASQPSLTAAGGDIVQSGDRGAAPAPVNLPASPPGPVVPTPAPVPLTTAMTSAPVPTARLMLGSAFGEQLGVAIARRIHQGAEEISVRMEPAELGRIEVKLAFDDGGSLRAVVSADSSTVLDTIRRDMGDLARALGDAGVRTDAQSFRFDRGSGGGSGSASNDGGSSQRGWQGGGDRSGSGHHQRHEEQYRPARRNGRLDLMA